MAIKTALIGFGFSGSKFHAPFLKAVPGFEVTHVVSTREEEIKSVFPKAQIVSQENIDNLFESSKIDLVIITTPNSTHYHLAKKALLFSKHVLLEKPFVLTLLEGQELIEIAKRNNKILAIYHNRRWDSDFLSVKNIISLGVLGKISSFNIRYDRYRPEPKPHRWKESNDVGSGTLWDLGAHLIDQALNLFGMPKFLNAELAVQRSHANAIDFFDIRFIYENKLQIRLSSSSICLFPGPKYEIHGTTGSFIKFGQDPQEQALIEGKSPEDIDFGKEFEQFYGKLVTLKNGKVVSEIVPSSKGCYIQFFKHLKNAINNGVNSPVQPDEALNVIKLILLCEESSKYKKTLLVEKNSDNKLIIEKQN
ncbi:Gfo/Idh/MocA family oxidoreductase [Candidatus Berkiella cookevillensis]|uniref:Gfo/Idh/MocA family oxidoreductase n=1 Tax=Candidatus Berkiella cookevillensis TaxID=437022 RepID=A0A0Q9YDQ5_9GAMM|nr:Gfo/Idh/MocA family oxidoreductase [Candidatus Berkiella cookevillensis]MCS5707794.1 Gfo/Idh/MocA family oxidoreductase [Candidatus Berkiella cookevillensis]